MSEEQFGRLSPTANPALEQVRAEGRRVTDIDRSAAASQLQEKGAYNRLRIADRQSIYRSRDPTTPLSASAEYRLQLNKALGRADRKAAAKAYAGRHPKAIAADKRIAQKMFVAGYSPRDIQMAMRCGSPLCARMSAARFNDYYRKSIQPALRNRKIQQKRQQMVLFKQRHGVAQSFRTMAGLQQLQHRSQLEARTQELSRQAQQRQAVQRQQYSRTRHR